MWITVRRLWLGAAILWSTVVCNTSGVVVKADDDNSDIIPEVVSDQAIVNDRGQSVYDRRPAVIPFRDVDEETETAYNPDDLSCRELRSKRYISDGFCTSPKPVSEVICAGECVPSQLGYGADYTKVWARGKTKYWRCVNDVVRQRRVHLVCEETGERRTYRISTVKSCKCKRYNPRHNLSDANGNANENANVERSTRDEKRRHRELQRNNRGRDKRLSDELDELDHSTISR